MHQDWHAESKLGKGGKVGMDAQVERETGSTVQSSGVRAAKIQTFHLDRQAEHYFSGLRHMQPPPGMTAGPSTGAVVPVQELSALP